jgi:uncharacterized protein YegL
MPVLTSKKATSTTPQVVTLLVDDSNSMRELADGSQSKAQIATSSIADMVMVAQGHSQDASRNRFVFSLAKFGDDVTEMALASGPFEVDLEKIEFSANSGWTHMAAALEWAVHATEHAIAVCRKLERFDEENTPPPIVLILSDGANTGPEVDGIAKKLHSIPFKGGPVSVIACGVGMRDEYFPVMKAIASSPDLAMNIKPSELEKFMAAVTATIPARDVDHLTKFVDEWDRRMTLGREALKADRLAAAEQEFLAALEGVRNVDDHRRVTSWSYLAIVHSVQGDWEKAAPFATSALDRLQQPSIATEVALEAGIRVAELLTIMEKKYDAEKFWKRIGELTNDRDKNLPLAAGVFTAEGFSYKSQRETVKARKSFEQAVKAGGVGAAAALRELADLTKEKEGRKSAEPFLEKLVEEMVSRFKAKHPLSQKLIEELRTWYILLNENEKIQKLDRSYR